MSDRNVHMPYKEWKDYAVVNYELVGKFYHKKVYEAMVEDPKTHRMELIQLTLREVLNKCEGTIFEDQIRRAVMKCVYTDTKPDVAIRKVMDIYYSA